MAGKRGWLTSPAAGGVVGLFAGGLTILLLEGAGHRLFGTGDPFTPSSITAPMFAAVLVAWVVGSWVGAVVATAWSRSASPVPGAVVGLLLLAGAATNMVAFPHPVWMMVAAVVLMPAAALLGVRRRRARGVEEEAA